MARTTPLLALHLRADALVAPYGPEEAGIRLVQAFDPVEIEYAAIRSHAAILDLPSRGLIRVDGSDRHAFLQRMLTQDLRGLAENGRWQSRRSFWLSRKGRIDADTQVIEVRLPSQGATGNTDCTLLELDAHAVGRTISELGKFILTEDVTLIDLTEPTHHLQLHGPAACAVLASHSTPIAGPTVESLAAGAACRVAISTDSGPASVLVHRHDTAGEIGLEILVMEPASVEAIYATLSSQWTERTPTQSRPAPTAPPGPRLAQRIGWHAFNLARIEAGTPLYNLDFGPTSLPHEAGDVALRDRVSFKKGCYLGQEVVARMESLGHPKQLLVALEFSPAPDIAASTARPAVSAQPITGSPILAADAPDSPIVGAVTSSGFSPMRGGTPTAFAMIKHANAAAGTAVFVQADGARLPARVRDSLTYWRRA